MLPKTISIIIPVYNEEMLIGDVVDQVAKADTLGLKKEIIIVDDGSTDGTARNIKQVTYSIKKNVTSYTLHATKREEGIKQGNNFEIKTIFKKRNEGKGAALKTGFKRATGDIFMVQDADKEYSTGDYGSLIKPFLKNKALIVYGSRNKNRENFHNRYSYLSCYVGGLILTAFINLLYNLRLSDQPTGYKLFSCKLRQLLLLPSENKFAYEVALTSLLAKKGMAFIEVPIHYKPRTIEEGKKINFLDFIESIMVAIKYRLTSH